MKINNLNYLVSLGAKVDKNGLISVHETKLIPQIIDASKQIGSEINRKVSTRIYSKSGYNSVKSWTDVIGK